MKLTNVTSSNILAIGHSTDEGNDGFGTDTLVVQFHNGSKYEYTPVDEAMYDALLDADSIGKHFNQHIRNNPSISMDEVE